MKFRNKIFSNPWNATTMCYFNTNRISFVKDWAMLHLPFLICMVFSEGLDLGENFWYIE